MQATATGPVLVAEQAVGIEVVGDALTQLDHDSRVDFASRAGPACARRAAASAGETQAGQHVDRSADRSDVVVADSTGRDGGRQRPATPVAAADRSATGAAGSEPRA